MNFEYEKIKSSVSHLHATKPKATQKICSGVTKKNKDPFHKLVTSFRQSIQINKFQNNSKYKTSKNSRKHLYIYIYIVNVYLYV